VLSTKKACPCGCTYPIMQSLEGRVADYVVTSDGNYISGISLTENFAMRLPEVKQMQIVQIAIDQLLLRIVKGECFNEQSYDRLSMLVRERFGKEMKWDVEYVASIQSEESGKYRFCISYVENPLM
jgi:phenylacetate-CoA ligase